MAFRSTKTFGHEFGLSCAFRQWRAESHCRYIHGYALKVRLEFGCTHLDENNWVLDFGSFKPVKEWLCAAFDHKLIVAFDDPKFGMFADLHNAGLADVHPVHTVGCEAFAKMIADVVGDWANGKNRLGGIDPPRPDNRVWLQSVEVAEHGGNSAIWLRS